MDLTKRFVHILPYLVFFTALFFVDLALFGISDALLGIILLFFARAMVESPGLVMRNYLLRMGWFVFMVVCATLAGLHPIAMVAVGVVYLFVVVLFNSDDYLPRNYFWLGMGFLLLLVYPVNSLAGVGMRLVATLFSVALTTAFVFVARGFQQHDAFDTDRSYVLRAFDDVGYQLLELARGNVDEVNPQTTFEIAQDYAEDEYPTVFRQGGVLSGRESYTFALLLCAEQVANMAYRATRNYQNMSEAEKRYFTDLSEVFLGFGQGRIEDVRSMVLELQVFLDTHALENQKHENAWRGVLESLLRVLSDNRNSLDSSTPLKKTISYHWKFVRENFSIRNTQVRFAIQLSFIVGIALLIDVLLTTYMGAFFGIWIPITAFAILNTYNDETVRATFDCLLGTVIGIAVFALFVHFIPVNVRMPIVVVLGYGVILMNFGRMPSMAAGTQMALAALYPSLALGDTLLTRLVLVILAASCVMMVIFALLRTQRVGTIHTKLVEMERIDSRLAGIIDSGLEEGHVDRWRAVQLLYYLHMNAHLLERLAVHIESQAHISKDEQDEQSRLSAEVDRVLQNNYNYAMHTARKVILLDNQHRHLGVAQHTVADRTDHAADGA